MDEDIARINQLLHSIELARCYRRIDKIAVRTEPFLLSTALFIASAKSKDVDDETEVLLFFSWILGLIRVSIGMNKSYVQVAKTMEIMTSFIVCIVAAYTIDSSSEAIVHGTLLFRGVYYPILLIISTYCPIYPCKPVDRQDGVMTEADFHDLISMYHSFSTRRVSDSHIITSLNHRFIMGLVDIEYTEDMNGTECTICFEELNQYLICKLNCDHIFHKRCIKRWFQIKMECPNCRSIGELPV